MRIGIDARFLTHPQAGGFKTYTTNLIAGLARVDAENEYVLYLDRAPGVDTFMPHCPNFAVRVVPGQLPLVGMLWREQVTMPRWVAQEQLDLFHAPSLTAPLRLACPLVVTIHDLIWRQPEKFAQSQTLSARRKLMEAYYRWVPERAMQNAAAIITVSHAARQSIVAELTLDARRITVTPEAADPVFRRIDEANPIAAMRAKFNLPGEFILAIGSADPRKNLATLVHAYARLAPALRDRYHLAIVWTHSFLAAEMAQTIQALGLTQVHFLTHVSNDDLVLLYNAATLFVFPSRFEGFGLPVLEAMACGAPVAAANNSSIPEIAGDAAILFDAADASGIADAITRLIGDDHLRARLSALGIARAKKFSWDQCARETIAVYRQIANPTAKE